ncbi:uncharacterized protein LOC127854674 [Dreissena polymorpha]|uniref:uncharacterized protein LOC127854674 n=1 Tax=Dreissena polymorpha TaxID=45954 RepID=UPI0022648005|nr:uncharacterized protein LOC127854674 [Dreissena polymorpha]
MRRMDKMLQFLKRRSSAKMPEGQESSSPLSKSLSALAVPGMYLFCKYNEFKRHQQEISRKKVTERELDHLNHKIDRLLAKIDDKDGDYGLPPPSERVLSPSTVQEEDDECVICMNTKATVQTFPCNHKVICRKCFIKTIQVAVSQRCLPLKCVICRTRIFKLRQSQTVKITQTKTTRSLATFFSKQAKVYAQ